MLDQAGKRDAAIGTLKSALALAPQSSSSPAARVRLAGLLIRKRDYDAAKQEFDKAEAFYQQTNNHEGLCDLWIARAMSLRTQTKEEDRTDLE